MNNKTRHITPPPPTNRAHQDSLADTTSPLYSFLTNPFSLESFKSWIDTTFLDNIDTLIAPKDYSSVLPQDSARYFKSCHCVANAKKIPKEEGSEHVAELAFFAFELASNTIQAKLSIHRALFNFAKKIAASAILACFYTPDSKEFRLSLITLGYDSKKREVFCNDLKRQSFVLGQGVSIHCALKQLSKLHPQSTLASLKKAFSIEPITEEFYKKILEHYESFHEKTTFPTSLTPAIQVSDKDKSSFILRLISRILFCKFLEKKLAQIGVELSKLWNLDGLDSASTDTSTSYYSYILEPLFYQTLNTPQEERNYSFVASKATAHPLAPKELQELLDSIPYLNGGLFEPQDTDFYRDSSLSIPDSLFGELFDTLEHYHFTIDESTPSNQEVGLDPEMLGMVFERLLGTLCDDAGSVRTPDALSKQKTTGSYYTPREIVSYMCKSTLLAHLTHKLTSSQHGDSAITPEDKAALESSLKNLIFHIEPLPTEHAHHTKTILTALSDFKVLDPACGSGAFPIGMLQEICQILETLDPEASHFLPLQPKDFQNKIQAKKSTPSYIFKLAILQNCIYGVDIQPMATEISRLRCFLSLIVDETTLEPLPNLEFKFLTANSLMPYDPFDTLKYDKYEQHVKELEGIRAQTFTTGAPKKSLQETFLSLISKMAGRIKQVGMVDSSPLTEWNPYDPQSQAKFFNSNFMFGVEKFDCVIGNPPYIDSECMKTSIPEEREMYRKIYAATKGNWDIIIPFFEMACRITKRREAYITFITTTPWLSKTYGLALRKILLNDLVALKKVGNVFYSANVDAVITFAFKGAQNKMIRFENEDNHINLVCKEAIGGNNFSLDYFSTFGHILSKISEIKFLLKELALCVSACTTSDAYMLKDMVLERGECSEDCFYIINTGTIGRFVSKYGSKPMRYLKADYMEPVAPKKAFCEIFSNNGKKLNAKYITLTTSPKIIIKGLGFLHCCIDEDGSVIPAKSTSVIASSDILLLKFLLGVLNSKLAFFYIKQANLAATYNGVFSITKDMINNFPIPKIDSTNQSIADNIIALVEEILKKKKQDSATDTTKLESQINALVYTLYNLTDEEIELIEKG